MITRTSLAFVACLLAPPAMAQMLAAAPARPPAAAPSYLAPGVDPDLAFGAYQRGYYLTAMKEAKKRLETNADDTAAMALIGQLYKEGLGIKADQTEANRWFRLAADRGDPEAAFSLALAYLEGKGFGKSREKALPLLEAAGAKGHPAALYQLGMLALTGDLQEPTRAAQFFQSAADAGDFDAVYALGLMYREGRGVEKDPMKASDLLKKAADARISAAEVDYAIVLFNAEGAAKDEAGAAKYFLRAAGSNNAVAMNRLARMYVAGRGVDKNMVEAMKWHILARAAGLNDDWLDAQLSRLGARDRLAIEDAVRKQVNN
jgi:TPR repeat protein